MLKNSELKRLESEKQTLFKQKQAAFQRLRDIQEWTNLAYDAAQQAWDERVFARECMDSELKAQRLARSEYKTIWDKYIRIRDHNGAQIESLKQQSNAEHRAMPDCYESANNAYRYGDKHEAACYCREGHKHKKQRAKLNAKVSKLACEVKQARANAKYLTSKIDPAAAKRVKAAFREAKERHESAQAEFERMKSMRNYAKAEFDYLHNQFKQAQAAFHQKLEEVKAEQKSKH